MRYLPSGNQTWCAGSKKSAFVNDVVSAKETSIEFGDFPVSHV